MCMCVCGEGWILEFSILGNASRHQFSSLPSSQVDRGICKTGPLHSFPTFSLILLFLFDKSCHLWKKVVTVIILIFFSLSRFANFQSHLRSVNFANFNRISSSSKVVNNQSRTIQSPIFGIQAN